MFTDVSAKMNMHVCCRWLSLIYLFLGFRIIYIYIYIYVSQHRATSGSCSITKKSTTVTALVSINDHPYSINCGYLLFFESTIMGKTADLAMVQKTIIDTLHNESKLQRINTEKEGWLYTECCIKAYSLQSWLEGRNSNKGCAINQIRLTCAFRQ